MFEEGSLSSAHGSTCARFKSRSTLYLNKVLWRACASGTRGAAGCDRVKVQGLRRQEATGEETTLTHFQPPQSHDTALRPPRGWKVALTAVKVSKKSGQNCHQANAAERRSAQNHFSLMAPFFSRCPHRFLLRQSSKVKSLFFPKIPTQKLFNIYLMTPANEKASCVETR